MERRKALLRLGISRPGSAQVTPTPSRGVSASASAAEAGASSSEVAANAAPPFIGDRNLMGRCRADHPRLSKL